MCAWQMGNRRQNSTHFLSLPLFSRPGRFAPEKQTSNHVCWTEHYVGSRIDKDFWRSEKFLSVSVMYHDSGLSAHYAIECSLLCLNSPQIVPQTLSERLQYPMGATCYAKFIIFVFIYREVQLMKILCNFLYLTVTSCLQATTKLISRDNLTYPYKTAKRICSTY
jgi:hypothetical protein